MDKLDFSARLADVLRRSREDCDKSQEYMARALGVSKKTVTNWETCLSSPSVVKFWEWFHVLNVQPTPYIRRLVFPDRDHVNANSCSEDIEALLIDLVKTQSEESKKQLLYLLSGEHGSSPTALLNMITAHLQSPLRDRINIAMGISTNYKLAQLTGKIVCPENVQPDMNILNYAIRQGMKAAADGNESYSAVIDEMKVNL